MRNILSYKVGSIFSGKEIKEWCKEQFENNGSHYKEAKRLYLHYNLNDNHSYALRYLPFGPGQDPCRSISRKFGFVRVRN